jgi:predicted transcriptional regulator
MKSYTLELDDELAEQLSHLDNAKEIIISAIKTLLSPQKSTYDSWFETEIKAALAESEDPNTQWMSHEAVTNMSKHESSRWLSQAQRTQ